MVPIDSLIYLSDFNEKPGKDDTVSDDLRSCPRIIQWRVVDSRVRNFTRQDSGIRQTYHGSQVEHRVTAACMMITWNGNAFHITGPLWGESTGHRWIPLAKGSVMHIFVDFAYAVEKTLELPVFDTTCCSCYVTVVKCEHDEGFYDNHLKLFGLG